MGPTIATPVTFAKQYGDGDVEITGMYADAKCAAVDRKEYTMMATAFLEDRLSRYSYNVTEQVDFACFDAWPYRPSIDQIEDGFLQRIEAAQGLGGIYFSGEILTGAGIPSLIQYVHHSIPKHFEGGIGTREANANDGSDSKLKTGKHGNKRKGNKDGRGISKGKARKCKGNKL